MTVLGVGLLLLGEAGHPLISGYKATVSVLGACLGDRGTMVCLVLLLVNQI